MRSRGRSSATSTASTGVPPPAPFEFEDAAAAEKSFRSELGPGARQLLHDAFGASFIDYYVRIKIAEIEQFQSEVTDWEQREYFELF